MKQQLNVYYDGPLDDEIDKALEDALKRLGFIRWASGYEFIAEKRDIAFEREVEDD